MHGPRSRQELGEPWQGIVPLEWENSTAEQPYFCSSHVPSVSCTFLRKELPFMAVVEVSTWQSGVSPSTFIVLMFYLLKLLGSCY